MFDNCPSAARILVYFAGVDYEMTEVFQRMLFLNRFNFNVKWADVFLCCPSVCKKEPPEIFRITLVISAEDHF